MIHQKAIVQKNDNDKDECKTCMQIQCKNEIINVEESIKEQQMIMENSKLDKEYNLKTLETMKQQKIENLINQRVQWENYQIFCIIIYLYVNSNRSLESLIINYEKNILVIIIIHLLLTKIPHYYLLVDIKLLNYLNLSMEKTIIKTYQTYQQYIQFIFLTKSNLLVSGSDDKSIVIWNQDCNTNWKPHQTLEGHQANVNNVINNENEDLLISGSKDFIIKFWKKTIIDWSCQQTIQTAFKAQFLSFNKSQTKLISCGRQAKEILVMELNSSQWDIKQTIQVNYDGTQLCFISDSKFLYQGEQECLEIYEYQQNEKSFIKEKTIKLQKVESYDHIGYPCKYLESKGFVIIQYGKYLNFFRIDENQNCELSYSIDFNKNLIIGNISQDAQYLITRNYNNIMYVRKLNQLK